MLSVRQSLSPPPPPRFGLKYCLRDEPEKRNNLKIFDFLKTIFILYFYTISLTWWKKVFFLSCPKQESTINAGESFFQVCVMQHILYFEISVFHLYKEIAAIFNVINTGLLKVFFDVINHSDGLTDLIYELRIISIVFSALAIVFVSLVLFSFVIANYCMHR